MNKLTMNNDNKRYYSDEYIRGWKNGVQAQYKADIESMPKGEWKPYKVVGGVYGGTNWVCSECGHASKYRERFCMACGAKMGGDGE